MKVSDAMTAQVVTATPSSTITEVARIMAEIESGAVPVTEDGKVVGMVTDRDIVIRVVAARGSLEGPVSAVMSENVETCREGDDLAAAAARMGARQIRRLVVLNAGGQLAGILSLGDIAADCDAKAVGRALEEVSENSSRAR